MVTDLNRAKAVAGDFLMQMGAQNILRHIAGVCRKIGRAESNRAILQLCAAVSGLLCARRMWRTEAGPFPSVPRRW